MTPDTVKLLDELEEAAEDMAAAARHALFAITELRKKHKTEPVTAKPDSRSQEQQK